MPEPATMTAEAVADYLRDLPLETVFDAARILVERTDDGLDQLLAYAVKLNGGAFPFPFGGIGNGSPTLGGGGLFGRKGQ